MKKSFLKTLSISLTALMGVGGLIGLAHSSKIKEVKEVGAASTPVLYKTFKFSDAYLSTIADPGTEDSFWVNWAIEGAGNTAAIEGDALHMHVVEVGGRNYCELFYRIPSSVEVCKIEVDAIPGSDGTTGGKNQNFSMQGNLDAEYAKRQYLVKDGPGSTITRATFTFTLKDDDKSGLTYIANQIKLSLGTETKNRNTQYTFDTHFFEMRIYKAVYSQPVTITAGTGVESVYLSESASATSGSASGTQYDIGKTIYGFAKLKTGYSAPSGWTLISGSTYRVGSKTVGDSGASFGTVNATATNYTISYTLNGGTHGSNHPDSYTVVTNTFTISDPTRTGYTFKGWSGTGLSGDTNKNIQIAKGSTGNKSFTANWTANTYTVQYSGNKPSTAPGTYAVTGLPGNATWTYDSNATLGSAPSLTGYVFDGWYKEESCTNKVGNAGQSLTKPNLSSTQGSTVTLFAKWSFDPAVQEVINKINNTKTCSYSELTDKIEIADTAYNALGSELQLVIDSEGYTQILNNAKAADAAGQLIEELGDALDTNAWRDLVSDARTAYNSLEDKTFIPNDIRQILLDDEAAIVVMDKINLIGDPHWTSPSKTLIDDAQSAYDSYIDAGHPAQQIANYQTLEDANDDYDKVDDFVNKVNDIGPSPYIYTDALKEKIDDARGWYDETLTQHQQEIVREDDEAIYEAHVYYNLLVNYENAYEASRLIDAIGDIENTPECKAKIEEARAALDALNETSELPLIDSALIKELEDDEAAFAVIELINAIYPMSYGQTCEDAIKAARDAYDALSEDQKPLVVNYDMLTKSENDYAKVKEVVEKVDNIGDIRYNQNSYSKISDSRDSYEALSKDQKDFFPSDSLQEIVDYEKAYETLGKIYVIGDVEYNTDSEEKINEARELYDSLTDAQKNLIHADDLSVLTKSEENYGNLRKKANILVILLLIFVSLAIVGGVFFLIFLLKRRKDKDDENKGTVKVASVGGLLPVITLASHYVDAPFIALFVLSGVAVLLWLTILGLVLYWKYKKQVPAPVTEEGCLAGQSLAAEEANAILESVKKSEEESKLVVDKKGNIFQIRYIKSFTAKLSQSSDAVKQKYNELKNLVLSYDKVSSRVSWHYDSINASKEQLVKFSIRGKTLCVYFSPKIENPGEGYKLEDAKGNRYEKVPYLLRIKSDKKFEQVKELIELLMKRAGLKKGKVLNDDYKIPYETTEVLLHKGLIKELATHLEVNKEVKKELLKSVAVEKVDELMSDDTAESLIEDDIVVHQKIGKREIINVDTLSTNFKDGDLVNLEALIEKKLVPSKTEYVKVLARGVLDKKLNVDLHDYSIQAVKMILLTGGTVKKIHE